MNDLASFGPSLLGRRLEAAFRDVGSAKAAVRQSAARDLYSYIDSPERTRVVGRLIRLMSEDANTEVSVAALLALLDGGAKEACSAILQVGRTGSARQTQMALLALGELAEPGTPEVVELALEAIASPLPALRYQGLVTLRNLQGLAAADTIIAQARDDDPELRWLAARLVDEFWALGSLFGTDIEQIQELEHKVRDGLGPLVRDANPRVRVAATLLLARLRVTEAVEALPRLLSSSPTRLSREDEEAAIELAGQLGTRAAVTPLERRAWPWLWESAISWKAKVALAQLGSERAQRAVLRELQSKSASKYSRAIEAVGQIGLEQARPRLLAMLANASAFDAAAIQTALERLGPSR